MAEQPVIMSPGGVPHHGPVGPDCPVDCLRTVLSLMTLQPLARAYDAFDPPRTVGDVMELYAGGRLREIRGLGSRRISEIEAALVLAGVDITGDLPRPHAIRGQRDNGRATVTSTGVADRVPPSAGTPGVNPGGGGLWEAASHQRHLRCPFGGRVLSSENRHWSARHVPG